jgi:hypothetical protein
MSRSRHGRKRTPTEACRLDRPVDDLLSNALPVAMPRNFDIDSAYEMFCAHLPANLREVGRSLAFHLGLVPDPSVPWSETFKHQVTLQAPALVAARMTEVPDEYLRKSVVAHMLAVIEAFGTDRISDGQVADSAELRGVLEHARRYRNGVLVDLGGPAASVLAAEADQRTREAIATEQRLFARGRPVSMTAYEAVSAGKQAVGLPASVVLAQRIGLPVETSEMIEATLLGIWLGLQFHDDVVDWEDDVARGGAWALLLASSRTLSKEDQRDIDRMRHIVLSSGILSRMLERAIEQFEKAKEGAERLGADGLVAWIRERVDAVERSRLREQESPGYLVRAMKLGPWAREVLG